MEQINRLNGLVFRDLTADEIELRVGTCNEKGFTLLLYKNARCDMNMLDETLGTMNWESDYKEVKGNLYAGIGVYDETRNIFVWKWDCGVESRENDGNEKKGEASDAFKRAGFKWGIGRELYTSPLIYIAGNTEQYKNTYVPTKDYRNLKVSKIIIKDKQIIDLEISKKNGEIVFSTNKTISKPTTTTQNKTIQNNKLLCKKCGAEITEKIANYSTDLLGMPLCLNCQQELRKNKDVDL